MKKLLLLLVLSTTTVAKPVEVYMQVQSPSPIPEAGYVTMEERKLSQIDTDDFDGFNSLFVGACVAKNSRHGNRTWNASGLIEAVSTATFLDCASWAFRHKKSPCSCYVVCSPTSFGASRNKIIKLAAKYTIGKLKKAITGCGS